MSTTADGVAFVFFRVHQNAMRNSTPDSDWFDLFSKIELKPLLSGAESKRGLAELLKGSEKHLIMEADDLMLALVPTVTSAQAPVADCQGAERAELRSKEKQLYCLLGFCWVFFLFFCFLFWCGWKCPPTVDDIWLLLSSCHCDSSHSKQRQTHVYRGTCCNVCLSLAGFPSRCS